MENPLSDLLRISLKSIEDIIDVNVIVGDKIELGEATVIPISKVKCGFISGGLDQKKQRNSTDTNPFGGGTGGNLTIMPVAFLVSVANQVSLLHLDEQSHVLERLIDLIPPTITKVTSLINSKEKTNNKK